MFAVGARRARLMVKIRPGGEAGFGVTKWEAALTRGLPAGDARWRSAEEGAVILRADSYGMCFGVRDAIQLALQTPRPRELTVLGDLVHNRSVLDRLSQAGIRRVASPEAEIATEEVLVTAHGVSESARGRLKAAGLWVRDATCPLVRRAHECLRRLVTAGYFPVVIGDARHVEVRGLVSDLPECHVFAGPDDVIALPGRERLGVVSQTTQRLEHAQATVARLQSLNPQAEVRWVDTICQPTKDRQAAARRLAARCDVVLVVGGRQSHNTRHLVETCQAQGARVFRVETAPEARGEWLLGARVIGLTAGTSTPEEAIDAVEARLRELLAGRPAFGARRMEARRTGPTRNQAADSRTCR